MARSDRSLRHQPDGRRAFAIAGASAATLALGAWLVGFLTVDPTWAASTLSGSRDWSHVGARHILTVNLACALLLYSGVVSAGLSALAGVVWTGAYVGATMQVGVTNVGAGPMLDRVVWYLPLELAGLLLAATAGFYPLAAACVALVRAGLPDEPAHAAARVGLAYLHGMRTSLWYLAAGFGLLGCAAGIEAVVIASGSR